MSIFGKIFKGKAAETESPPESLPVAGLLNDATARGAESKTLDPYPGRPMDLHIPATRNLAGAVTYIGIVAGPILSGGVASIESGICVMVRYSAHCEYHPDRSDLCAVDVGAYTGLGLVSRARFLGGPFRAPQVFCADPVAHDHLKRSAKFRARPVWAETLTLEVASIGVASLLNDIERGAVDFPSHRKKCAPSVEQIKLELASWNPRIFPSIGLLAVVVAAEACRKYAPRMPIEHFITPDGRWALRRMLPQPNPNYLRRDPTIEQRKQEQADRDLQEGLRRGAYLVATNFGITGDPDKGKDK